MSDTPETDRIIRNAATADHPPTRLAATLTVKCEKLERERDEALKSAKEMSESNQVLQAEVRGLWLKSWANTTAPTDNETYLKLVLEEVAKLAKTLKAERDEAREHWGTESVNAAQFFNEKTKAIAERDELRVRLKVMQAERDVARISARKSDEAHDRVIGDLERADVMAEKAKELIARWDQPSWKDTAPTAGFIYALRDAVEAYEKTPK